MEKDKEATDTLREMLYQVVRTRLDGQEATMSRLTGRSKDYIGAASIATTLTGVLANKDLSAVATTELPLSFAVLLTVGLVLTVGLGFVALWPRTWYFSPDVDVVYARVRSEPDWDATMHYASIANGFVNVGVVSPTDSAISLNDRGIRLLKVLLIGQTFGLAVLAGAGLILAWRAAS